ncbi:MAG: 50S ribosomal protein L5, partial [Deltaproteobacteria bacterium]|nr:50S ribosomal protein L5 [Deltaproteobacteria bacterium]
EALLIKALAAVGNKLKAGNFDKLGNFSFGIKDYDEIPGMKYDPRLGMFGMDVCVNMGRKGYRVKDRKVKTSKIGTKHLLTKAESIKFISQKFGVEIEEKVKAE